MYLSMRSPVSVRTAVAMAALSAATIVGTGAARADGTPVATTFTATLSGSQITATLTAADGTIPAGELVFLSFRQAGDVGATRVNADVADANGQVRFGVGSPDIGTTYWFDAPGDDHYAGATSNSVHVSATVMTRLFVSSDLSGVTVSGIVRSLHDYRQAGTTVRVYAGASTPTQLVGSSLTDDLGGWSVTLPPISRPTTFQARSVSNPETNSSVSNLVTMPVSTRTSIEVTVSGGHISVHGAVTDGLGAGQAGEHMRILARPAISTFHDVALVTTDAHGQYSYTTAACVTACAYEAAVVQDAAHVTSWAISGTITAPTKLTLSAHTGRPDHVTATLTYAATDTAVVGQGVTVYYHYAGHSPWTSQHVATTDRYGRVTLPEQPRRGCYFTARYAGTPTIAAAASANSYLSY